MFDELFRDRPPLPALFASPSLSIQTPEGLVQCHEAGGGRTILLLHSISSLGTSFEIRPLFEHLAKTRRAVALDWLGFGGSERPERSYSATVYQTVLRAVLRELAGRPEDENELGRPPSQGADVVALSLAAQYVAALAVREPERFGRLVLISPTGLGRFVRAPGLTARTAGVTLRLPGLGQGVFDGITTREGIRRSLENLFADAAHIPAEYERYAWASARQPGARYAPLSHLAGLLDDPGAPQSFRSLGNPALMIFGERARFSDPAAGFELARRNSNVTVQIVPGSGDMPQLEHPELTAAMVTKWVAESAP
ncbi:MAG: alpha/beta hydrolase [Actinomycetota bacterium]|nr:alpha/beta hydrolase [Actinomycetota bacterium]